MDIGHVRTVAADLRIAGAHDSCRVRQLSEVERLRVENKYLEIAIGVLVGQVAIRRERDEATVVANRRLKTTVGCPIRSVARKGIRNLDQSCTIIKKNF